MRAPLAHALAFAWVLAVPGAFAQPPVSEWVMLEIEPFADLVEPLKGPIQTHVTARASCLLVDQTRNVPIAYRVASAPSWATALVSPSTDAADVGACEGGYVTRTATLTVTASDQAPAFTPSAIVVEATAGPADRAETATASVDLSAKYFPVIDVQLAESIATVAPGESHTFVVKVSNFGNADTRVEATIVDASPGLTVTPPGAVVLQSKQAGGNQISADLAFVVRTDPEGGFVNRVGLINARIVGAYATDDAQGSEESTVSFLVTTRTGGEKARDLPLSPLLPLVALVAALAFRRR